jgi:preprotein translocase subunit Sss1
VAAAGAILRFAVTAEVDGLSLPTVGLILLIVGGIGFVVGLALRLSSRGSTPSSY